MDVLKLNLKHGKGAPLLEDFDDSEYCSIGIDTSDRKYGPGNKGKKLYLKIGDEIRDACEGYLEKDFLIYSLPITKSSEKVSYTYNPNAEPKYSKSTDEEFFGIESFLRASFFKIDETENIGDLVEINHTAINPSMEAYEMSEDNRENENAYVKPIRFFSINPEYVTSIKAHLDVLTENVETIGASLSEDIGDLEERVIKLEEHNIISQGSW